jgi:hypothetical protein
MGRRRFSEERIVVIPKKHESGARKGWNRTALRLMSCRVIHSLFTPGSNKATLSNLSH